MKRSIAVGANKPWRKVNYFPDDDERRILQHPNHQCKLPISLTLCMKWVHEPECLH